MPGLRDLGNAWRRRPPHHSRHLWALILALDRLRWPLGENLLACCFVISAFVGRRGRRQALAWATAQPDTEGRAERMARGLCANQGRFLARGALVGIREPELLERHVVVRGEEHLRGHDGRGTILIGFHLGPRNAYLALRAAGHALTWMGGQTTSGAWARSIRERYQRPGQDLLPPAREHLASDLTRVRLLYRARRILLDGGRVFIGADGVGAEAFSLPLPGGPLSIRAGWLSLREATGAPVLPVLSHMDGPVQVVTIHPPLPAPVDDPARDLHACRQALGDLLQDYLRRFPEQCPTLAFAQGAAAGDGGGSASRS
jgi:lauroyl/myristoyl acyltransferase